MAPEDYQEIPAYRHIRDVLRVVLVVVWIGSWYSYLLNDWEAKLYEVRQMRAQHVARCNDVPLFSFKAAGCASEAIFGKSESDVNNHFDWDMTSAVIFSFIMFFPARILARLAVDVLMTGAELKQKRDQQKIQSTQQHESQLRIASSQSEMRREMDRNNRAEIIMKMGSVNDMLDVMQHETDPARLMNMRLGIAQALRELQAKYDHLTLSELINSDDVVSRTIRTVAQRLKSSSLSNLVELENLEASI